MYVPDAAEPTDVDDAAPQPGWSDEQARAAARLASSGLNHPTLDRLVELAASLLGARSAQISLLTDVQTAIVGHGLPPGEVGAAVALRDSVCLIAASEGRSLAIADARADPRTAHAAPVTKGLLVSYLGTPLIGDSGVAVGSLCVFDPEARQWSEHDVALLEQIARSTRAELELAALTQEYETDKARWELAVQAGDVGTFDWNLITGDLAWDERLIALYGYESGDVHFDRSISSVSARVHPDDAELVSTSMADSIAAVGPIHVVYRIVVPPGHVRWLEARGRALPAREDPDGPAVRLLGISWDVTAVQEGEARADRVLASMPVGFLAVDSQWQVTLANAQAAQIAGYRRDQLVGRSVWDLHPSLAGSAIDAVLRRAARTGLTETTEAFVPAPLNRWLEIRVTPGVDGLSVYFLDVTARRETQERLEQRASHDRTVATTLQSVLLSELPSVVGVNVIGRYLAAAEADQVGGDWYDAITRSDGSLTVMIGDVVGHDIVAAASMGQLRAMLRMAAWNSPEPPSDLVRRLDLAASGMHLDTMATLVLGRLEPAGSDGDAWTLRWTNAGHPPPVVLDPDGTTRMLDTGSSDVLLGVTPTVGRRDHVTSLAPGSTLLLYTDGLVEVRGASIDDGIARLRDALSRHHHLGPDALLDAVLSELILARPEDDTAVLALHVARPAAGVVTLELAADLGAPARARAFLREHTFDLPAELQADAQVLTSELVSNAVLHGHAPITLDVDTRPTGLRVTVHDRGTTLPSTVVGPPDLTRSGGRGLLIVDALSSEWGVTASPDGPGTSVWFGLEVPPTAHPASG